MIAAAKDFRGIPIEPGDEVAIAARHGEMKSRTVKHLEHPGLPKWWINVWFEGGGYTTPDRVAVVQKAADRSARKNVN